MSDTLALQDLLLKVTGNDQVTDQLVLELELFTERYREGAYRLANEADLKPLLLERVLKNVFTDRSPALPTCSFVGIEDLCRDRAQQLVAYRAIRRLPLSLLLEQYCGYRGVTLQKIQADRVPSLVRRALGTHQLELALDRTLGRDFASIALENIVAAWCYCCYAVMANDHGRVSGLFVLAKTMQDVLPLGRTDRRDDAWVWTCLVNKGAGQIISGGSVQL
jgi:hypothetical protein